MHFLQNLLIACCGRTLQCESCHLNMENDLSCKRNVWLNYFLWVFKKNFPAGDYYFRTKGCVGELKLLETCL